MSVKGLLINSRNVKLLTSDEILSFNSKEYWHKFILKNGGLYDKEAILQAVLDLITPFDLIPVNYTIDGVDSYFLARNCKEAIEKLCLNLLNPLQLKDAPKEITIGIQICSIPIGEYKMNMQCYLKKAIEKRYDENQKGFINLSSFHKDPELYEVLFCPLSKPKILVYVLSILKKIFTVTSINLSNNGIEILKSLEILHEFKELISLDLSNNKISDENTAEFLGKITPNLKELNLRGNPVCSVFKTETDYLEWIKNKNLSIKILDGISINYGFPNHQVYLYSEKSWIVVNKFLKHYFTLYDNQRQALEYVYKDDAIFSFLCDDMPSEFFKDSKVQCHRYKNKFFMRIMNKSSIMGTSNQANNNIINALLKLPMTEHDLHSFKVDVLFYTECNLILTVSGIFKDYNEVPEFRSFNRNFVLSKTDKNEYKITNDMWHVTNATEDEINASFLHSKSTNEKSDIRLHTKKREEEILIKFVSTLTEMNSKYSKRCLEDSDWNVERALKVFLENYEASKIPQEAFIEKSSFEMGP